MAYVQAEKVESCGYLLALAMAFCGFGAGLFIVRIITAFHTPENPVFQLLLGLLPFQITSPLMALTVLRRMASWMGWRRILEWDMPRLEARQRFKLHIVLFVLAIICSFGLNMLSKEVCEKLGIPFEEQSLIQMAHGNSDVLFWAVAFFSVMVLAPCVEELLYRLVLYKALKGMLSRDWMAACLTSFCFALAHGVLPMIPALFVLGMLFQEAKRRGGLKQSIMLHSCYNGLMLLLVLLFDE